MQSVTKWELNSVCKENQHWESFTVSGNYIISVKKMKIGKGMSTDDIPKEVWECC